MKKTIVTILTSVVALTLTSCQPVAASEMNPVFTDGSEEQAITTVQSTESGLLYNFSDGTGYYTQYHTDIPGISTYNGLYPLTGIITEIEYEVEPGVDLLTMTCANGNMFSWYEESTDCWELNDLASCLMDSNGTKYVYDDEVILAHYAGSLDQLAEFTCK